MMAAVALSIAPILVLYVVAQRWFVEGIAMTGQKG
jgi:ABC-type glycerol-3-phosphate transport system permease component